MDNLWKRCEVRRWVPNNFTFYLLETGRNAGAVAKLFGCPLSTTNYWLRHELSASVNVLFLLCRKVRMSKGFDLLDLL